MAELKVFSQLAGKGLSGAEVHISMRGSRHNRRKFGKQNSQAHLQLMHKRTVSHGPSMA